MNGGAGAGAGAGAGGREGGVDDTSDVTNTDGDDDIFVDKSVNDLLADELAGNGGDETELELTDGGDDGGHNKDGGDDSDGDLEVSAALSDSSDSVLESITKRHPQMKMKQRDSVKSHTAKSLAEVLVEFYYHLSFDIIVVVL